MDNEISKSSKKDIDISKLTVRINKDIDNAIFEYANRYGMSKNALIIFILGQWIDNKRREEANIKSTFDLLTDSNNLKEHYESLMKDEAMIEKAFNIFNKLSNEGN